MNKQKQYSVKIFRNAKKELKVKIQDLVKGDFQTGYDYEIVVDEISMEVKEVISKVQANPLANVLTESAEYLNLDEPLPLYGIKTKGVTLREIIDKALVVEAGQYTVHASSGHLERTKKITTQVSSDDVDELKRIQDIMSDK